MQARSVRRLVLVKVSAERIAGVMKGRGTDEAERMFLGGIEVVTRAGEEPGSQGPPVPPIPETVETWKRLQVEPGVELHLRHDASRLRSKNLENLMAKLEELLRKRL